MHVWEFGGSVCVCDFKYIVNKQFAQDFDLFVCESNRILYGHNNRTTRKSLQIIEIHIFGVDETGARLFGRRAE